MTKTPRCINECAGFVATTTIWSCGGTGKHISGETAFDTTLVISIKWIPRFVSLTLFAIFASSVSAPPLPGDSDRGKQCLLLFCLQQTRFLCDVIRTWCPRLICDRSEEHTSELQSLSKTYMWPKPSLNFKVTSSNTKVVYSQFK